MADKAAPKAGQARRKAARRRKGVNLGGRPKADPEHVLASPVLVRLPGSLHALLAEEADARGESLAATARDILHDWFTSRAGEPDPE